MIIESSVPHYLYLPTQESFFFFEKHTHIWDPVASYPKVVKGVRCIATVFEVLNSQVIRSSEGLGSHCGDGW